MIPKLDREMITNRKWSPMWTANDPRRKITNGTDFGFLDFLLWAWLHGEFQPGLKFRSAHRAEILLRLHCQFQPGRKTPISVRKFTEVRKHNWYACSRSFFSPGWKNDSDYYMNFSARLAGVKILARYSQTGLGFSARVELRPGLNPSPCNRQFGLSLIHIWRCRRS